MLRFTWFVLPLFLLAGCARSPRSVLETAAGNMGATGLKAIEYSGSGSFFALGQSVRPDAPWPRFNMTSYTRTVNYEDVSSREELVRTQGENPPRGGGNQPLLGERRQAALVSGDAAWNVTDGGNPAPAPDAAAERQLAIWLTPHGFLKAALAAQPTMDSQAEPGKHVLSFSHQGRFQIKGTISDQNLVEKVETWVPNPVLGDMPVEITYADYRDFNGVKFPARIVQKQGGFPTLELTVSSVEPNATERIETPEAVRQAAAPPVRVESERIADGVWFVGGGSHNSVAVEFQDHAVVIEGPQNEARSEAVIAEVKRLLPTKPVRYLVNTHHHFDHSGGIRTYAAEGATILTHEINRPFYERVFGTPRTLTPDKLAESGQQPQFETVTDKHTLSDASRTLEIHLIQGNSHNEGILMAYLPRERILIEADVYTPPAPNAPPPSAPSPFTVNLYENLQRLKLNVRQILPLHGRPALMADLLKALGRTG